jgi:hypothetical protein
MVESNNGVLSFAFRRKVIGSHCSFAACEGPKTGLCGVRHLLKNTHRFPLRDWGKAIIYPPSFFLKAKD